MNKHQLDLFKRINKACGVSGHTTEVSDIFIEEATKLRLECGRDSLGSTSARFMSTINTSKVKNNIMITAHSDHVGYVVYDKGVDSSSIILAKVGAPLLVGEHRGVVKTESGRIKGVITGSEEDDYFAKFVLDSEGSYDLILLGDPVFYHGPLVNKPAGKFTGSFMDNKASIFALLLAMEKIVRAKKNAHNIYFVLTEFEETGAYGAIAAVNKIKPFFAINLDVFPVDTKRDLSIGAIISRGPVYNPVLVEFAKKIAEKKRIPHRVLVPSPSDESDTNYIIPHNGGTPCCELGVPCMNVHLPNEIVSKRGIVSVFNLVSEMCSSSGDITSLIPGGSHGM